MDKELFKSHLEIDLQFCTRGIKEIERKHISRYPWEKEIALYKYSQSKQQVGKLGGVQEVEEDMEVVKRLRKWEKFAQFPSLLPNRLVWKFDSENQGAFRLKFCHSGKYLAAACTLANGKSIIKIFDVEDGNLQIILRGHNDLVHDLDWSYNDRFLVSASADGTVRVWNLQDKETIHSDATKWQNNDRLFFITEFFHPTFVYGAKIHPTRENESNLYVATICFDGKVRIWSVNIDDLENPDAPVIEHEMCINNPDPGQYTVGSKKSKYDADDNLEDEALKVLMDPQDVKDNSGVFDLTNESQAQTPRNEEEEGLLSPEKLEKLGKEYKSMIDSKHPNCM